METHFYSKLDVLGQMSQKRLQMGRKLKVALCLDMIPTYKRLWGKMIMLKIIVHFITGIKPFYKDILLQVLLFFRDIFSLGFGPFRWVCTSGDPTDLRKTDKIATEVLNEIIKSK